MTKRPTLFRIKEIAIPDTKVKLFFTNKKDFLRWVEDGGVYITDKPDADGLYTFYCFDNTTLAIIFKQKSDELW